MKKKKLRERCRDTPGSGCLIEPEEEGEEHHDHQKRSLQVVRIETGRPAGGPQCAGLHEENGE